MDDPHSSLFGELKGLGTQIGSDDLVDSLLPQVYEYKVISCDIVETSSFLVGGMNFDLEVRVNLGTVEDVKTFLTKLNDSSGCTFNVDTGRNDINSLDPRQDL